MQSTARIGFVDSGLSHQVTKEAADHVHRAADLVQSAGQTMPAMMGADLGHLCALQHGDGHRELSRGHWRKRAIAGVQHKTIGLRDSSR